MALRSLLGAVWVLSQPRTGPAVRSASLLEQRGFELPVLFVVPGAYERLEVSAGFTAPKPGEIALSEGKEQEAKFYFQAALRELAGI